MEREDDVEPQQSLSILKGDINNTGRAASKGESLAQPRVRKINDKTLNQSLSLKGQRPT